MITNTSNGATLELAQNLHQQVAIPVQSIQAIDVPSGTGYILFQPPEVSTTQSGEIKRETTESEDHSIEDFVKATSIDDFLWYNCPKCDFKCKTSPNFIEHIVQIHPYAKTAIEDLTNSLKKKTDQDLQVAEEYITDDLHRYTNESDEDIENSDEDYNPNADFKVSKLILTHCLPISK